MHKAYKDSLAAAQVSEFPTLSKVVGTELVAARKRNMPPAPVDGLSEDKPIILQDKAYVVEDFLGWLTRLRCVAAFSAVDTQHY